MLRLDTQFEIRNLHAPRLFKVITLDELITFGTSSCAGDASLDDLLLYVEDADILDAQLLPSLPLGGLLIAKGELPVVDEGTVLLSNPRDAEVVRPGDVIALSPSSRMVRVLYRRGANSNLLFMTDRCNSLCLMCSQPPKDIDDQWHIEENLRLLDLIDPCAEQLGISGGEPTLYKEGLLAIIDKAKRIAPAKSLHVLSNGRLLSDPAWIAELKHMNHPALTWGIPLYGDTAEDHDHLVQAEGAFSETIRGIYNLGRAGQRIEIRVVLNQLTIPRLPQLAHFIFRNMPFVEHIALMGIESTGLAKKNHQTLWIDPLDYQDTLSSACHFLEVRGMNVSIYNLPLCVLKPSLMPFYRRSISDWKNLFIEECDGCSATEYCAGFFKSHSERWKSRSIHPLSRDELSHYTRSMS
jgi:His-Xaa-Ser system radical SAM maturase HxsC